MNHYSSFKFLYCICVAGNVAENEENFSVVDLLWLFFFVYLDIFLLRLFEGIFVLFAMNEWFDSLKSAKPN